ncbi:CRISPR-associated protein Cmr2 [Thermoanaerobacter uzonensis DSM 18761]|uniref:CRISPR-associated protein Cmr2 n=1 Tax=Thermoanaerobacter uzonensis DSM 18761 TaxID=1123369 RepID=A0A1M5B6S1_9THEO|nr:type III-B CRISPR-associated protein Cas10/Cmr2 [Thermoanaerobacter uzonensis]SHF38179.1 CRISPR-associated protein Cmr2 [Thermoanaerobacter uzonensis DSM 18761]
MYENISEGFGMSSLFLFTIGPVQQFISQARKTQDLYAGSFLLSYLTFIGLEEIIEKYGVSNVIYPDLENQPFLEWHNLKVYGSKDGAVFNIDLPTIPNRFVALIPEIEEKNIAELAEGIKRKIKNEWNNIVKKILHEFSLIDNLYSSKGKTNFQELVTNQTKDFPEIYWVAIPLKKDGKEIYIEDFYEFFEKSLIDEEVKKYGEKNVKSLLYHFAYSALERAMGVRKNVREFEQTEEYGYKCKVCGVKEGVIKAGVGGLEVGEYISKKENICIRCFTKRAIDKYLSKEISEIFKDYTFPSTAEIAALSFKKRMLNSEKGKRIYEAYLDKLKEVIKEERVFKTVLVKPLKNLEKYFTDNLFNIEGEWLFEENLTVKNFEEELGVKVNDREVEILKRRLKELTGLQEVGEPNPYYGIILFDGDNMGKWLSGHFLPHMMHAIKYEKIEINKEIRKEFEMSLKNGILSPISHFLISQALKNYSIKFVKKIVEEEHLGKVVYAGGDDILAFVNVEELFDVMRKLRASFSGNVRVENDEIEVDWENTSGFVRYNSEDVFTLGEKATASCGVLIAHYKDPLQKVLGKLRAVEKKAKEHNGKDSFAISLLKRSGEERIAVSKWRVNRGDILEKLKELSIVFSGNDEISVSDKVIYVLKEEFKQLKDTDNLVPFDLAREEIKRVIRRSIGEKDDKEKKEKVERVVNSFIEVFESYGGDIDNFLNLISISAFVGKGVK